MLDSVAELVDGLGPSLVLTLLASKGVQPTCEKVHVSCSRLGGDVFLFCVPS
jgi:hypothetical protein